MASRDAQQQTTAVQVAVRVRPLSGKDRAIPRFSNMSEADVLKIQNSSVNVVSHQKTFTFDYVFGPNSTQDEIFVTLASPLIHKFIDGYNVTILAYGQTSSGKTYTMGTAQHADGIEDIQNEGIIPRAMSLLFETLSRANTPHLSNGRSKLERKFRPLSVASALDDMRRNKSSIKVSFVEIYNEDLVDLLNPAPHSERPPVTIREDSKGQIYWSGVRELAVENTNDVLNFLEQGTRNRATGATDMNEKSSRSHAIFSVTLRQEKWVPSSGQSTPIGTPQRSPSPSISSNRPSGLRRPESSMGFRPQENGEEGDWIITHSKFHFVDLAGSERLKRTAAEGDRRKEGININGGLLALGNVISALGDPSKKSTHVPYRDSKLTRLLQDSLGGNATTLMIACVSPAEYNLIETVNTLMYANRARNIRNRLEKNEFEEWQTNDNAEFLRGVIIKLKTELRAAKTVSIASSTTSKDLAASSQSLMSDGHSSPSTTPDMEQVFLDQRNEIMNLQHLIEKLEGELAVTQDREQVAEDQLKQMWKNDSGPRPEDIEKLKKDVDFEHLVEPVIEEYEKSISVLESQLAMARAALHHSDIGFEEQSARITHLEQANENQSHIIVELRSRISKVIEREQTNDLYIQELENKLSKISQDSIHDQEAFIDLKAKLAKLTETEDSTEQYIGSLEQRLANVEKEKDALAETVQALEISSAAKDTAAEALKIRVEQAERGDDQRMLLHELDDSLQRYQYLETQHNELQSKYNALVKNTTSVEKKQQVESFDRNHLNEQDSTLENGQKRHSLNFQEEINVYQQAAAVVEKEKQIVTLTSQIEKLESHLLVLEKQNQETNKKLTESVKANEQAESQIDKLEKIVQEQLAKAEEEKMMSSEPVAESAVGLYEEMERQLSISNQKEHTLQHQLEKAQQDLGLINSKLNSSENERSQLEHTVQDIQMKLDAAQADIQDASIRQQDLINSFDSERTLLQKSTDHLESEIKLMKIERDDLQSQISNLNAEVDKKREAIAEVPKAVNGHMATNHFETIPTPEDRSQIKDLQEALAEREKHLEDSTESIRALKQQLEESTLSTQSLSQKISELTTAQDETIKMSKSYDEISAKHMQLQDEFNLYKQELDVYKQQLSESQDVSSSLRHQLDEANKVSKSYDEMSAKHAQLQDELNVHKLQLSESKDVSSSLQQQLDEATKVSMLYDEISLKYTQLQDELNDYKQQLFESKDASYSLQQQLDEAIKMSKSHEEISLKHSQLQDELNVYKQQLGESQDRSSSLQQQLDEAMAEQTALSQQLVDLGNNMKQSDSDHEAERSQALAKLKTTEDQLEASNRNISSLQKDLDRSVASSKELMQKLAESVATNKSQSLSSEDIANKYQLLQSQLAESEAAHILSKDSIQGLYQQLDESHAINAKLTEQVSELTTSLQAHSQAIDAHTEKQAQMQAELAAKEAKITAQSEANDAYAKKHSEIHIELEAKEAKITAQSEANDAYAKKHSEMHIELEAKETKIAELDESMQILQKLHDESVSALDITNDKLLSLQKELDDMKASHTSVSQQLSEVTSTLNSTDAEVQTLRSTLDDKSKAAEIHTQHLQSEIESGVSSLKELRFKHNTVMHDFNQLQQSHADLHKMHELLTGEHKTMLEDNKLASQSLQSTIDNMIKSVEQLKAENGAVESKLQSQHLLNQTLQTTVDELTKTVEDIRKARDIAEAKLVIQTAKMGETKSALENQITVNSDLEAKFEEMRINLQQIQTEAAEAAALAHSTHQREREEEVELYENAIMELEIKLQSLSEANNESHKAMQSRHIEVERELAKVKEEVAERDMFIVELEKSIDRVETDLKASSERLQEKSESYAELEKMVAERDMFIAELEKTVDRTESELKSVQQQLRDIDASYSETQQLVMDREADIDQLRKDLENAKRRIDENESEKLQKLDMQVKSLQEETEEYNMLIEQMDNDIQNKSAEMEEIIAELASAEAAKVQSQARVKELEQEILLIRSISSKSEDVKVVDSVNQPAQKDHVDQADVADHAQKVDAYEAQVADLKTQVGKLTQEKVTLANQMEQLTVDNSQLQAKSSAIEQKLETQTLRMSKEAEDLRHEIAKLIAKNEAFDQQANKRSGRSFAATRDTTNSIISPPQTPRVTSPSPDSLQNKLKLHETTIAQQAQLIKSLEDQVQKSLQLSSIEVAESLSTTEKKMRKSTSSASLPPPPSEPLPPIPSSSIIKATSVSSMKSSSGPEEVSNTVNTTEQYDKTIKSLQKKLGLAETDVKAHLEVITKLEQQLFRAENAFKATNKRASFSPTRNTDDVEADKLKTQLEQAVVQQEKTNKELKKLQSDLEAERSAKEKAEKARLILENRIDQLMSKKSKFMCF